MDRIKFETGRRRKERLVFPNRVTLVVVDHPSGGNPALRDVRPPVHHRTGLRLSFLLEFPTEPVRIRERLLIERSLSVRQIAQMRFSAHRVDNWRLWLRCAAGALV